MLRLTVIDLARHRVRTAVTAVGVALGVATIVAILSLTAGIERAAAGLIHLGGAQIGLFQADVGDLTASALPASLVPRVAAIEGVSQATPVSVAADELPGSGSFLVFGVEPRGFVMHSLVFLAGRAPRAADELVLGQAAAAATHLGVGDTLRLRAGSFRVVGVYDAGVPFENQGAAVLPDAAAAMRGSDSVTTVAVRIALGARTADVTRRLERAFHGTVAISQPGQIDRVDTNSLLVRQAALAFAALALIVGGIAVANTMLMAVFERRTDFALLMAIGWPRRLVAALVLQEGVALSLVGAVLGIGLGVLAGSVLVDVSSATSLVSPHVSAWTLARAVLIAGATGLLGSLYPAWWITRMRPAEVLG